MSNFKFNGLFYKRGAHGRLFYFKDSFGWYRSGLDETEMLKVVNHKADPFSTSDEPEFINEERPVKAAELVKRMQYLEWLNNGSYSDSDISKMIMRPFSKLKLSAKVGSSSAQKEMVLMNNIHTFPKRTQEMIRFYYSDSELDMSDVALQINLCVETVRATFRKALKSTL